MEKKKLICVECPVGCEIEVTLDGKEIKDIKGNACPRGKRYAENEVVSPRRVITSTVRASGGKIVPVKTDREVLKEEIFAVMERINKTKVKTPVKVGDVLVWGIADGVNLIATANIE